MNDDRDLEGLRALVTGATSGIGMAAAGKPSAELPPGTERSILRQAGLNRRTP